MTQSTKTNLDTFYSSVALPLWQQILGDGIHYHFGYFESGMDFPTALRQAVRNFYPFIPPSSTILDVGCGWGGPAQLLQQERHCTIHGLTVSRAQYEYCRAQLDLTVSHLNVETEALPRGFDIALLFESFEHIENKTALLHKLRLSAEKLILLTSCMNDGLSIARETFGGSIILATIQEIKQSLADAGWKIIVLENRRLQSIPTFHHWRENLERVFGQQEIPGQLRTLKQLCDIFFSNPVAWCKNYPLLAVVAEKI